MGAGLLSRESLRPFRPADAPDHDPSLRRIRRVRVSEAPRAAGPLREGRSALRACAAAQLSLPEATVGGVKEHRIRRIYIYIVLIEGFLGCDPGGTQIGTGFLAWE